MLKIFLTFRAERVRRKFLHRVLDNRYHDVLIISAALHWILGAALIRGRRLKEGGAYIEIANFRFMIFISGFKKLNAFCLTRSFLFI